MEFIVYDILLLIIFAISISIFLKIRRKNLKKEGWLLLYKTSWGIKLINRFSKKHKKLLEILSYVSIFLGYVLMITMIYLFLKLVWIYTFNPEVVKAVKIPPIMPLIPYLPRFFKLDFLPPFYFIYWIIIIAVIAIPHEFAHGIFAAFKKVKIKTTGFGFFPYFFPIFLAAFVEPDENQMKKKDKFTQMAVLSAGTFANVLTAIFFGVLLAILFTFSFSPVGLSFDAYSYSRVNISSIMSINDKLIENSSYDNLLDLMGEDIIKVGTSNGDYLTNKDIFASEEEKNAFAKGQVVLYDEGPAFRNNLSGIIAEIDEVKMDSREKLSEELLKKTPGQEVTMKMYDGKKYTDYKITLGENPRKPGVAWLGVGFIDQRKSGIMGRIVSSITFFKKPNVYYEADNQFSEFIYNLFWWIILVSITVALMNMLPVGIFDGGRFFYLTILGLTKSEKTAKKAFSFMTFLFMFFVLLIMFFWAYNTFL